MKQPATVQIKTNDPVSGRDLRIFIVAGEHSGDALGAKLMAAINARARSRVCYLGVGGEGMEHQGLISQFPMEEVAVMGPLSILPRLPRIVTRVYGTAAAGVAAEPDVVVIIDAPEFTHPIAKRIRKKRPWTPIIDYVSPSVWAWRPGRAKKMARYVDHVLALLPFEPEAHERLGGPECTYVGHPLIEKRPWMLSLDPAPLAKRLKLDPESEVLAVLPGSRPSEVFRLMPHFGEAVGQLVQGGRKLEIVIPAVASVRPLIETALERWPVKPHLVEGEEDKFRTFRLARAALAASGTVTLELALAGTPMVVAYKVDRMTAQLRRLIQVPSVVLANLVAGENYFPEYLQEDCTGEHLAGALDLIMKDTPERARQLEGLALVPRKMQVPGGSPSEAAAEVVLRYAAGGRR